MSAPTTDAEFADMQASVRDVAGWLTDAQARRLWTAARALGASAQVVELGSFQGRSTIVLARATPADGRLVAIDPHTGTERSPRRHDDGESAGRSDHDHFLANLAAAGVTSRVRHVRKPSADALGDVEGPIDLLYIDGSHAFRAVLGDLRLWATRVRPGGRVLVHDAFSSIGVTLALLRVTFLGPSLRYEGRSGSLAQFVVTDLSGGGRVANALRQTAQLPWFLRNIIVKLAIAARLHPLARLLGHHEGPWPY
jgi:predicted O-methyltransferase YrrM